jgi:hypothetical protein
MDSVRRGYYSIYVLIWMFLGATGITVEWIVRVCGGELFTWSGSWQRLLMLAAIALYCYDYFAHRRGRNPPKWIMNGLLCFWPLMAWLNNIL